MRIEGVLYVFATKGQRRTDEYLGHKVQNSHLIYAWKRIGSDPDFPEWAWTWSYTDEDSGKKTTLGKGWRKVPVWSDYPGGVKAWVEALANNEIRPRHINALESLFPQSLPVSRRPDEIQDWKEQTLAEETRWMNAVRIYDLAPEEERPKLLNQLFPQSTARCFDYNSRCPMWDACFVESVKADPLGSGLYQIRLANHPEDDREDEE